MGDRNRNVETPQVRALAGYLRLDQKGRDAVLNEIDRLISKKSAFGKQGFNHSGDNRLVTDR